MFVEVVDESCGGLGGIECAEGVEAFDDFPAFFRDGGGHGCFEESGEDGIDTDAVFPVGVGEGFGEAVEGSFCGGVGGLADGWVDGGVAGDEDDVAFAFFHHCWEGCFRAVVGGGVVDLKDLVPCVAFHGAEGLISDDPGGADE